ncbi:MAG: UDP-N-acetylglucosamine 2-epimerase (non-hydrolyzing) [Promethearchaeota archaeon]
MKRVVVTTGTRPEIIKLSLLIKLLKADSGIETLFIHSGQHYDDAMFSKFLADLELPQPDENFHLGSGSHVYHLSTMMTLYERTFTSFQPDLVIAQGDTNTVLASALTARKMDLAFGHVEAGLRSFDRQMPEEINRILAAYCTELHFAPTKLAVQNLLHAGIAASKIFLTGNPIVDVLKRNLEIAKRRSSVLDDLGIRSDLERGRRLVVLTTHRPANVDHPEPLKRILEGLRGINGNNLIVFPVHPRTSKSLERLGLTDELEKIPGMLAVPPLGYLDFLILMERAKVVITDSGGMQEEALVLGTPCVVLRENTERPETLTAGRTRLVGSDSALISRWTNEFLSSPPGIEPRIFPFGTGDASRKIFDLVTAFLRGELSTKSKAEGARLWTVAPRYAVSKVPRELAGKTYQQLLNEFPHHVLGVYDASGNMITLNPEDPVDASFLLNYLKFE